jgi:heme-degrading monooxygenase HmoA
MTSNVDAPAVFVNVLKVDPSKQQELIDLLREGTEKVMRQRPGFISATLLAAPNGSEVINIARWRSLEDVKATQSDPAAAEYARRTAEIAQATPGVYRAVSQIEA